MDPISNTDQLVLLLQRRLMERSRAAGRTQRAGKPERPSREPSHALSATAALGSLDDEQLRRALVQNMLADAFGRELVNDAKFQQVADKVVTALQGDPDAAALLSQMVGELRASA